VAASQEFGSYVVYEQLGVGGMASVHVAETRSAGGFRKRVALKRLLSHAAAQPELVESFTHEAKLARYLHHANIAQTFDFGQVEDTYFIAMELVSGPTLGQLIRQCKSTIGVIPFPITLNILQQLCDALEYAHTCVDESGTPLGIIHRDVSPPNVVISNTGIVKLIDFGLAKAKTSLVQTQVGTVKGKFRYMAPEYLTGKLDRRVDLWALGIVAHELLTTHQLFDGDNDLAVLERVRSMKIDPPSSKNPDVPPELDAIVMTALERDPDKRWQSAGAMKTALADVAAELQTVITNQQLVQWCEWAFTQEPPGDRSELSQLITLLEQPSRPSGKSPAKKRATSVVRRTAVAVSAEGRTRKPRLFSTPRVGASIAKRGRPGARRVLWLLLLLTIVGAGAYAAWFYGFIELPGLQRL
jgi:serine/threonine protein kinase